MGKKTSLFYELIFDGNFLEDHPLIMSYEKINAQGFNQFLCNKGISLRNIWPHDFTLYLQGDQDKPIDFTLCGLGLYVFSKSAAEVICSVAQDDIELLPVKTMLNGKAISADYYLLNVLKSVEALNWEATIWKTHEIPYEDDDPHMRIIKPAFNSKLIKNEPIFLLSVKNSIMPGKYISGYLKQRLEERKCTIGMAFMPIKTVDAI